VVRIVLKACVVYIWTVTASCIHVVDWFVCCSCLGCHNVILRQHYYCDWWLGKSVYPYLI
jgi:hypothetical protein